MTINEGTWLQTDEAIDVVASLRHATLCLELARTDLHAYKWAFLALHSALQGACVCHLTTTAAPIGALNCPSTRQWNEYLEKVGNNAPAPATRILDFPELLKAVRRVQSAGNGSNHEQITITDEELNWLKYLHDEVRNQFTHFAPQGWDYRSFWHSEVWKLGCEDHKRNSYCALGLQTPR